jgi:hypothetical protein
MRVTVTFADDVAAELQRMRRERSIGLSEAVNELVRTGMARKRERQAEPEPVKQAIHENDVVALTKPVDKVEGIGTWPTGTTGTVVAEHSEHKMIAISNDRDETLDFISEIEDRLKLVAKYS